MNILSRKYTSGGMGAQVIFRCLDSRVACASLKSQILCFLAIYDYRLVKLSSSVQLLSHIWLFVTPWTAACQASLSITNSWSLLTLMSIESVMSSNHLILCCPLVRLPSIFPSTRVFSNESVLHIRWPKDWSFSFSISPSNEYSGLISFRADWLDLLLKFEIWSPFEIDVCVLLIVVASPIAEHRF